MRWCRVKPKSTTLTAARSNAPAQPALFLLLLLLLSQCARFGTSGAGDAAEAESYLTILYPYKESCFTSAQGLLLAAALSSHTWEHHPQGSAPLPAGEAGPRVCAPGRRDPR